MITSLSPLLAATSSSRLYSSKHDTKLNKFSQQITSNKSQGGSQAMRISLFLNLSPKAILISDYLFLAPVHATGLTREDLSKAQVGISSVWYEGNPCNMHLNDLAAKVKEGVVKAGLVGYRFNTIGVSDGISMGTDGMSYSLQSRDIIADSIETVGRCFLSPKSVD